MATTINRSHAETGSRYEIDAALCPAGWSQLDTDQDASWFGIWASPKHQSVVSYCEGDISRTYCDTAEEFCTEIRRVVAFHRRMGEWKGIDPGLKPEARQAWIDLGLADLLHQSQRQLAVCQQQQGQA